MTTRNPGSAPTPRHGVLYHGGVPGLKPGDRITPGHDRLDHGDDGCPICRARRIHGKDRSGTPDSTLHPESVYCTESRLEARLYASLYGHGDVYQVRADDEDDLTPADEGDWAAWRAPALTVVRITDAAVELSAKERRRIARLNDRLDRERGLPNPDPMPRNIPPAMADEWIRRHAIKTLAATEGGRRA